MLRRILIFLALLPILTGNTTGASAEDLRRVFVFAAASTQPVFETLKPTLADKGIDLIGVYAGSSTLARQIAQGAPADIFVSANIAWMDDLATKDLLEPEQRLTIATNRLAVIAASGVAVSPEHWPDALGADGRLALADPGHVPAGRYAQEALNHLGLWAALKDRLAPAKDVTGALMLVARGEAPLGIVYLSDVRRAPNVTLVTTLPADSHAPIVYQGAIVKGHASPAVHEAFEALSAPLGQDAFVKAGFSGGNP